MPIFMVLFFVFAVFLFGLFWFLSSLNMGPKQAKKFDAKAPNLLIRYKDNYGNETLRKVKISPAYVSKELLYIEGHCFLRNERRTFRVHGIIEATDLETGEIIEDLKEWLRNHRAKRWPRR